MRSLKLQAGRPSVGKGGWLVGWVGGRGQQSQSKRKNEDGFNAKRDA
jgi:hypothetical protein